MSTATTTTETTTSTHAVIVRNAFGIRCVYSRHDSRGLAEEAEDDAIESGIPSAVACRIKRARGLPDYYPATQGDADAIQALHDYASINELYEVRDLCVRAMRGDRQAFTECVTRAALFDAAT